METHRRPTIISTDPGIDDAVALAIASFSTAIDLKLIATVAGNVSVEKTTLNAQNLVGLFDKKIPIAMGSKKPLLRPIRDASGVHGKTGMDGYDFSSLGTSTLVEKTAVEEMHNVIMNSPEPVTIVGIGPLTDIALLIHLFPEVKENIEELVLMGGALGRGNFGVLSEFNFAIDPEAAKMVFESKLKIRLAPMEVARKVKIMPETSEKIKTFGNIGMMIYKLFSAYRGGSFQTGLNMYDALAIGLILNPNMFTEVETYVDIETSSTLTSGASLIDLKGYLGQENNCFVAVDIDQDEFEKWFVEAISSTQSEEAGK